MKPLRPVIYSLVISLACMVMLVWGGLWYTNYVDKQAQARTEQALATAIRESNRKWCNVVILFDDTYKRMPPTTPTGQTLAKFFAERRKDFDCDGGNK